MRAAAYVLAGVLVGGFGVWGVERLWAFAGELDAEPPRNGVQERFKQRKSDAMHDLLDAMVEGRLDRVEAAAAEIEDSAKGIDDFLSVDAYQEHGQEFFMAVRAVRESARGGDLEATKRATLRLERSCFDCHQQLNRRVSRGQWR